MTMQERWNAAMMPNYGTPPIAIDHGEGKIGRASCRERVCHNV